MKLIAKIISASALALGIVVSGVNAAPAKGLFEFNASVLGVLKASGSVKVESNGNEVKLKDGIYVYSGGETIRTDITSRGVLQLGKQGSLSLCPGSEVKIVRNGNKVLLDIIQGSARFAFREDAPFEVRSNGVIFSPPKNIAESDKQSADAFDAFKGEVVSQPDGVCLICELQKSIAVRRDGEEPGQASADDIIGQGEILKIDPVVDASVEGTPEAKLAFERVEMPVGEDLTKFSGSTSDICACQKIAKKAFDRKRRIADQQAAPAEPEVVAEAEPVVEPQPEAAPEPEVAPEPKPEPEPVVVAKVDPVPQPEPTVPLEKILGFDPNELPPTAAGDPDPTDPVPVDPPPVAPPPVALPPVLLPSGGSGGGAPASPS